MVLSFDGYLYVVDGRTGCADAIDIGETSYPSSIFFSFHILDPILCNFFLYSFFVCRIIICCTLIVICVLEKFSW